MTKFTVLFDMLEYGGVTVRHAFAGQQTKGVPQNMPEILSILLERLLDV